MSVKISGGVPDGFDMIETLLKLLAEQESLKITYEITNGKEVRTGVC